MVALLCCYVAICWFFGSKPTFWKPSQSFFTSWRAKSQVGAPKFRSWRANLARQNCQLGGQVRLSRAPTAQSRAPNSWIGGGTLGARQQFWRDLTVLARQVRIWRANSGVGARQLANLGQPRPGKPTLGLFHRVGVFSVREGHETRGFSG